jgi:hypothetical protein
VEPPPNQHVQVLPLQLMLSRWWYRADNCLVVLVGDTIALLSKLYHLPSLALTVALDSIPMDSTISVSCGGSKRKCCMMDRLLPRFLLDNVNLLDLDDQWDVSDSPSVSVSMDEPGYSTARSSPAPARVLMTSLSTLVALVKLGESDNRTVQPNMESPTIPRIESVVGS